MYCPKCGTDVTGHRFCGVCGKAVDTGYFNQNNATTPQSTFIGEPFMVPLPSKKNTGLIAVIVVLIVVILLLVGTVAFFVVKNVISSNSTGGSQMIQQQIQTSSDAQSTDEPEVEEEYPENFYRHSTYNSAYTYKNMNEIYASAEVYDNKTIVDATEYVESFNKNWINYINTGNTTVFNFLRADTAPYKYAVAYGAKNIHEEYLLMEFYDVRKAGNDYFVWSHEIIRETSLTDYKVKEKEYHWIYKINGSTGGFYIENYISDPAYK